MDLQQKEALMASMKAAIDLETDIATQESIIQRYTENSLARKPVLVLRDEPSKPAKPSYADYHPDISTDSSVSTVFFIGGIGFAILGVILLFSDAIGGIITILVSACLCTPFCIRYNKKKKAITQQNSLAYNEYQHTLERYNKELDNVREHNERVKQEYNKDYPAWEQNNQENLALLSKHLSHTKELLAKLYTHDFVYSKYQNLPALTSIYEYILTGRCDELTGPHGAYNLYEDEVRKDMVISQLNTVIENLEKIKQNQYMLYQQVKKISDETSIIKYELDAIRGYTVQLTELTALNTYYSALTASNTSISATFHLLNG